MNTEQRRQTTVHVTYSKLPGWQRRLKKMQECNTLDALVTLCGPPHHKVQQEGFEIWHYPLGIEADMTYSIHVSVWPDQSKQAFLYFEPAGGQHTASRKWWQFWKNKDDISQREIRP